jgi:hypothetical protein
MSMRVPLIDHANLTCSLKSGDGQPGRPAAVRATMSIGCCGKVRIGFRPAHGTEVVSARNATLRRTAGRVPGTAA